MGSALLNTESAESTFAPPAESGATGQNPAALPGAAAALRLQAAERLAAHRSRHGRAEPQNRPAPGPARPVTTRSARIAATVAERYAHTQSYRAFLAAEAERAVQQARAAAEIAALNAQAVAAAQQSLLDTFDQATPEETQLADLPAEPHGESQQGIQERNREGHSDELAAEPQAESATSGPVELSLWPDLDAAPATRSHSRPHRSANAPDHSQATTHAPHPAPLTVRLYEDAASAAHVDLGIARRATTPRANLRSDRNSYRDPYRNDPEALALDEEIAFRHAPVFEEPAGPPMPLPANLIEFPRQLVAPRKARPRLAEGPLRDEAAADPTDSQLRIFEVDPAQISTTPAADAAVDAESTNPAPQWTSIWLDASAEPAPTAVSSPQAGPRAAQQTIPLQHVATIGRRTLAAAVNGVVVLAGVLAFATVFVMVAGHVPPGQLAALQPAALIHVLAQARAETGIQLTQLPAAAAVTGGLLLLIYQTLFFCFSTATPGMRCVRIALCTFDDENPTRKAVRRRILAVLLSACPLGLGFLWAALDEDRLTWHDRLSRMYQRTY